MKKVNVKCFVLEAGDEMHMIGDIMTGQFTSVRVDERGQARYYDGSRLYVHDNSIIRSKGKYYHIVGSIDEDNLPGYDARQKLLGIELTFEFLLREYMKAHTDSY